MQHLCVKASSSLVQSIRPSRHVMSTYYTSLSSHKLIQPHHLQRVYPQGHSHLSRSFATERHEPSQPRFSRLQRTPRKESAPLPVKEAELQQEQTQTLTPVPLQNTPTEVADQTKQDTTVLANTETTALAPVSIESVLNNATLVVSREIEWGNVIFGYEQANKYSIKNEHGEIVGYIAEETSLMNAVGRQLLRNHRNFKATIFDAHGREVLVVSRPAYLISSSLHVNLPNGEEIGEVHMQWHLWRRQYNLFLGKKQFAHINGGFLEWDFQLVDEEGKKVASVNKDWTNLPRELFTDGNQYLVKIGEAENERKLSTEEKAITLATAITVDFDYFSRSSRGGLFPAPILIPPVGAPAEGNGTPEGTDGAPAPTAGTSPTASPDATTAGTIAGEETMRDNAPSWGFGEETSSTSEPSTSNEEGGKDDDYWTYDGDEGGDSDGGILGKITSLFGDDD